MKHLFIILVCLAFVLPAAAQEATPEPAPPLGACPSDQLADINDAIDNAARQLSVVLFLDPADHSYEIMDDVTIQQRAYWDTLRTQPLCVELYTRGYTFGRVIDEYAIAIGLGNAAVAAVAMQDSDNAERLQDQAMKHIRNAQRLIETRFPDYYDLLVGDD